MSAADELKLRRRLAISADVVFETAWRIGSGREGETMSDLGVVLDPQGRPVLPGSSLKGKLRATCEALAHALGLTACMLDVAASGVECISDIRWTSEPGRDIRREHQRAIQDGPEALLAWLNRRTCGVCKLFGSPGRAARLRISDGTLRGETAPVVQVRDGVVLDRDSHTAVPKLKYDFEVSPSDVRYGIRLDVDNPSDADLALLGAALFDWSAGSSLGGGTSRGLGRFRLENIELRAVNFEDPKQRRAFLTSTDPNRRLTPVADWQAYFTPHIERQAATVPQEA
jgi:CRISPR-associated RAMP protein (TIGR02581 family)